MGLDFIRKGSDRHRKKWKDRADFFKQPTLFDGAFGQAQTSVAASLHKNCGAQIGDTFVVEHRDNKLILSKGLDKIGEIPTPSSAVISVLAQYGGVALGEVKTLGAYGMSAQLSLK